MDLPLMPEGSAVLEMGCGNGKTLSALPGGWSVVALDVSPLALRLARRARDGAHFILADASRLPLLEKSFDAVFAFRMTGHLLTAERCALAWGKTLFCGLQIVSIDTHCWKMHVEGEDHLRAKMEAVFLRN